MGVGEGSGVCYDSNFEKSNTASDRHTLRTRWLFSALTGGRLRRMRPTEPPLIVSVSNTDLLAVESERRPRTDSNSIVVYLQRLNGQLSKRRRCTLIHTLTHF